MATPIPANRCAFTADEITRATGATAHASEGLRTAGVTIDSRATEPGALFVALRGLRDGHEFVRAAAEQGAIAAVVEHGRDNSAISCFEVSDTLTALGRLAHYHLARTRAARRLPVIAIGGAAGKTTTKDLAAALSCELFGETLATPGNLNNLIGVPMTALTLTDAHRAAVLECGTNCRGEITRLARLVEPEVALVLNVDIEHTEGLGSLEGVADEEAALFTTARIAVVGIEESMLTARVPNGIRTVTFGAAPGADVRLISRRLLAPGRQQIALALAPWMVEGGGGGGGGGQNPPPTTHA
jgi:UDP-N-acetylmuramoyl-tripeptide--D-alanyl-D-alanine ligase